MYSKSHDVGVHGCKPITYIFLLIVSHGDRAMNTCQS